MQIEPTRTFSLSGSRWIDPVDVPVDLATLHDLPVMAQILFSRGFRSSAEIESFLNIDLQTEPDPFLLPTMGIAVERVLAAIEQDETIGLFGDYDADGVTSVAIVDGAIREVAGKPVSVRKRLPTRAEGYGLNRAALDEFANAGVTLLIVVDCGSTDHPSAAYAQSLGMDMIILDHHQMSDAGPDGAILVSARVDETLPYQELSAAGLAYLLGLGLAARTEGLDGQLGERVRSFSDLAAIGLVADISPLTGASRHLVREGLRRIRKQPRLGVEVLCEFSQTQTRLVASSDIGFRIGPRINAAGRMSDPAIALELLQCEDPERARKLAAELERLNIRRRVETNEIVEQIHRKIAMDPDTYLRSVIVVAGQQWNQGLVGLAAGNLTTYYGRPAVVLAEDGEFAVGSARSVSSVNIYRALRSADALLERYGGHSEAAGMKIRMSNVDTLREQLSAYVDGSGVEIPCLDPIEFDADLEHADLTMDVAKLLGRLSPFGAGNPEPLLRLRNVQPERLEIMGKDKSHLRICWRTPIGEIRAPFFGMADQIETIRAMGALDIALTMSVGWWNGLKLDVHIKDLQPASRP